MGKVMTGTLFGSLGLNTPLDSPCFCSSVFDFFVFYYNVFYFSCIDDD